MSTASVSILQFIQNHLIRYISLIVLIFRTIDNIHNCFIFTLALYFGCLTHLLITFDVYSQSSQSSYYCRTRTFFTYTPLSVLTSLVVAACADRYTSSSSNVRLRSFSQIKISRKIVCGIFLIQCFIWGQQFVRFSQQLDGINCFPATPFCVSFNNFSLLMFYSILPIIFMLALGWMTIRHVCHQHTRRPSNLKDRQLTIELNTTINH
ncbi:unnamed protein product [Rotaria magnacalcarata]|uniref:G-protein coupled receptors family 1 profile domain-containing protein n=1 Tax=Rotaria magnacalcarata TaxID=392030 RepID=A0A815M273_9BILA|nr:unnamed protein product [Rotaria magnacalcarata]CAF4548596.1 unnamed protein product [Rotaria magnacalcarata]